MITSSITNEYKNKQSYAQVDAVDGTLSRPVDAGVSNEKTYGYQARDSVAISQEARETAKQQTANTVSSNPTLNNVSAQENLSYSSVKHYTTTDGTNVNIESAYSIDKNGLQQVASVRVHLSGADGEVQSHTLNTSSVLSQDEDGNWTVKAAEGNSITGTGNDDIVILLPTGKRIPGTTEKGMMIGNFTETETTFNVDAGEGNNVVMDFSGEKTQITTGSGNDTIVGSSNTGCYVVHSGAGNDTIELTGHASYVYAGEGDDRLTLNTTSIHKISAGAGDDSINIQGNVFIGGWVTPEGEGIIDGGDGDDSIHFERGAKGTIFGGKGNDKISYDGANSSAFIDGGEGDDTIRGEGNNGNVKIEGGTGNDTIMNIGGTAFVHGGDGDDNIRLGIGSNFYVSGEDGNDYIEYSSTGGSYYVNGGDANDTIEAVISGGTHYITGGVGDDNIITDLLGGGYVYLTDKILDNSPKVYDKTVNEIYERLEQLRADRKEMQRADNPSTLEIITDYDKRIAASSLGAARTKNIDVQDATDTDAPLRALREAEKEIRQMQQRKFQRAIVAYEQQFQATK